jgi:hypothetical protein
VVTQSRCHRWSDSQGLVDSGEIVIDRMNRNHRNMVLQLLAKAGISNHVWSIAELCDLLPENRTIGSQIDKGLILKALGE